MKTKEEAAVFLKNLLGQMNTQNNHCTAAPYFYVIRSRKWRVAHDEYNSGTTRKVRVDFSGDPTTFHSKEEFMDWAASYYEDETKAQHEERWGDMEEFTEEQYHEDDNVFFTEEGYREHLRLNGHNLGKRDEYDFYIKHAFRNPELVNLFKAISLLVDGPWSEK